MSVFPVRESRRPPAARRKREAAVALPGRRKKDVETVEGEEGEEAAEGTDGGVKGEDVELTAVETGGDDEWADAGVDLQDGRGANSEIVAANVVEAAADQVLGDEPIPEDVESNNIGFMAIGQWKNDLTQNLAPYCEVIQAPNGQNGKQSIRRPWSLA